MTAALTADAAGLDALVVEKSAQFGGSTALSGGGIWVPGAPSQRKAGYVPDPDSVLRICRRSPTVSSAMPGCAATSTKHRR